MKIENFSFPNVNRDSLNKVKVFKSCLYVLSAVLALWVSTFNIHGKTGAPSHSALGCITSEQFRSATGTLTVTSKKGCPGTLSQTCKHLLWGLVSHSSHADLAGKRTCTFALGQPNDSNCSFEHMEVALISEKPSVFAIQTPETLEISCETLCEDVTPATRDANLNVHFQIHTVQFLQYAMDLHTPSLVSFGTKNLLTQSKRTCPDLLNYSTIFASWAFLKGVPAKTISKGHWRKHWKVKRWTSKPLPVSWDKLTASLLEIS